MYEYYRNIMLRNECVCSHAKLKLSYKSKTPFFKLNAQTIYLTLPVVIFLLLHISNHFKLLLNCFIYPTNKPECNDFNV